MGEEALVLATVRSRREPAAPAKAGPSSSWKWTTAPAPLRVTFFNQAWRAKQLPEGTEALFFGKLDTYRGKRQLTNPVVDLVGNRTGRDRARLSRRRRRPGIAGWEFGEWVEEALRPRGRLLRPAPRVVAGRARPRRPHQAFGAIHAPQSFEARDRARRRLAFDELWRLQIEVVTRRLALERDARGIRHAPGRRG